MGTEVDTRTVLESIPFGAFIPFFPLILRTYVEDADALTPSCWTFPAAILIVDVSGFSNLSEKLAVARVDGTELLTSHLNAFFASLISVIYSCGGDAVSFSGDAINVMFPASAEQGLPAATLAALGCAEVLRADHMSYNVPVGTETVELSLHMSIASGGVSAHVLPGGSGRWKFVLCGRAVAEAGIALSASSRGEVVIAQSAKDAAVAAGVVFRDPVTRSHAAAVATSGPASPVLDTVALASPTSGSGDLQASPLASGRSPSAAGSAFGFSADTGKGSAGESPIAGGGSASSGAKGAGVAHASFSEGMSSGDTLPLWFIGQGGTGSRPMFDVDQTKVSPSLPLSHLPFRSELSDASPGPPGRGVASSPLSTANPNSVPPLPPSPTSSVASGVGFPPSPSDAKAPIVPASSGYPLVPSRGVTASPSSTERRLSPHPSPGVTSHLVSRQSSECSGTFDVVAELQDIEADAGSEGEYGHVGGKAAPAAVIRLRETVRMLLKSAATVSTSAAFAGAFAPPFSRFGGVRKTASVPEVSPGGRDVAPDPTGDRSGASVDREGLQSTDGDEVANDAGSFSAHSSRQMSRSSIHQSDHSNSGTGRRSARHRRRLARQARRYEVRTIRRMARFLPTLLLHSLSHEGVVTELRLVSTLFIKLTALSDAAASSDTHASAFHDRLCAVCTAMEQSLEPFDGTVNKLTMDDKGLVAVVCFGLPGSSHEDDPLRACHFARAFIDSARDLAGSIAIGVTRMRVYCGVTGSVQRSEYTVLGDGVNTAARLMTTAEARCRVLAAGGDSLHALPPLPAAPAASPSPPTSSVGHTVVSIVSASVAPVFSVGEAEGNRTAELPFSPSGTPCVIMCDGPTRSAVLSSDVEAQARAALDFVRCGSQRLKGKTTEVPVFQVKPLRIKSQPATSTPVVSVGADGRGPLSRALVPQQQSLLPNHGVFVGNDDFKDAAPVGSPSWVNKDIGGAAVSSFHSVRDSRTADGSRRPSKASSRTGSVSRHGSFIRAPSFVARARATSLRTPVGPARVKAIAAAGMRRSGSRFSRGSRSFTSSRPPLSSKSDNNSGGGSDGSDAELDEWVQAVSADEAARYARASVVEELLTTPRFSAQMTPDGTILVGRASEWALISGFVRAAVGGDAFDALSPGASLAALLATIRSGTGPGGAEVALDASAGGQLEAPDAAHLSSDRGPSQGGTSDQASVAPRSSRASSIVAVRRASTCSLASTSALVRGSHLSVVYDVPPQRVVAVAARGATEAGGPRTPPARAPFGDQQGHSLMFDSGSGIQTVNLARVTRSKSRPPKMDSSTLGTLSALSGAVAMSSSRPPGPSESLTALHEDNPDLRDTPPSSSATSARARSRTPPRRSSARAPFTAPSGPVSEATGSHPPQLAASDASPVFNWNSLPSSPADGGGASVTSIIASRSADVPPQGKRGAERSPRGVRDVAAADLLLSDLCDDASDTSDDDPAEAFAAPGAPPGSGDLSFGAPGSWKDDSGLNAPPRSPVQSGSPMPGSPSGTGPASVARRPSALDRLRRSSVVVGRLMSSRRGSFASSPVLGSPAGGADEGPLLVRKNSRSRSLMFGETHVIAPSSHARVRRASALPPDVSPEASVERPPQSRVPDEVPPPEPAPVQPPPLYGSSSARAKRTRKRTQPPRVLVIRGESGSGRTTLLRAALRTAALAGPIVVVPVNGSALSRHVPWGALQSGLSSLLATASESSVQAAARSHLFESEDVRAKLTAALSACPSVLKVALAVIPGPAPLGVAVSTLPPPPSVAINRFLGDVIAAIADLGSPLLIGLDDGQWMDPYSLQLLHFCAVASARIHIVISDRKAAMLVALKSKKQVPLHTATKARHNSTAPLSAENPGQLSFSYAAAGDSDAAGSLVLHAQSMQRQLSSNRLRMAGSAGPFVTLPQARAAPGSASSLTRSDSRRQSMPHVQSPLSSFVGAASRRGQALAGTGDPPSVLSGASTRSRGRAATLSGTAPAPVVRTTASTRAPLPPLRSLEGESSCASSDAAGSRRHSTASAAGSEGVRPLGLAAFQAAIKARTEDVVVGDTSPVARLPGGNVEGLPQDALTDIPASDVQSLSSSDTESSGTSSSDPWSGSSDDGEVDSDSAVLHEYSSIARFIAVLSEPPARASVSSRRGSRRASLSAGFSLPDASTWPTVKVVNLMPISVAAVATLIALMLEVRSISLALAAFVSSRSGGNVLFVQHHVQALVDARYVRVLFHDAATLSKGFESKSFPVPPRVEALLTSFFDTLGPVPRHMLKVLAATGEAFCVADAVAMLGEAGASDLTALLRCNPRRTVLKPRGDRIHSFAGAVDRATSAVAACGQLDCEVDEANSAELLIDADLPAIIMRVCNTLFRLVEDGVLVGPAVPDVDATHTALAAQEPRAPRPLGDPSAAVPVRRKANAVVASGEYEAAQRSVAPPAVLSPNSPSATTVMESWPSGSITHSCALALKRAAALASAALAKSSPRRASSSSHHSSRSKNGTSGARGRDSFVGSPGGSTSHEPKRSGSYHQPGLGFGRGGSIHRRVSSTRQPLLTASASILCECLRMTFAFRLPASLRLSIFSTLLHRERRRLHGRYVGWLRSQGPTVHTAVAAAVVVGAPPSVAPASACFSAALAHHAARSEEPQMAIPYMASASSSALSDSRFSDAAVVLGHAALVAAACLRSFVARHRAGGGQSAVPDAVDLRLAFPSFGKPLGRALDSAGVSSLDALTLTPSITRPSVVGFNQVLEEGSVVTDPECDIATASSSGDAQRVIRGDIIDADVSGFTTVPSAVRLFDFAVACAPLFLPRVAALAALAASGAGCMPVVYSAAELCLKAVVARLGSDALGPKRDSLSHIALPVAGREQRSFSFACFSCCRGPVVDADVTDDDCDVLAEGHSPPERLTVAEALVEGDSVGQGSSGPSAEFEYAHLIRPEVIASHISVRVPAGSADPALSKEVFGGHGRCTSSGRLDDTEAALACAVSLSVLASVTHTHLTVDDDGLFASASAQLINFTRDRRFAAVLSEAVQDEKAPFTPHWPSERRLVRALEVCHARAIAVSSVAEQGAPFSPPHQLAIALDDVSASLNAFALCVVAARACCALMARSRALVTADGSQRRVLNGAANAEARAALSLWRSVVRACPPPAYACAATNIAASACSQGGERVKSPSGSPHHPSTVSPSSQSPWALGKAADSTSFLASFEANSVGTAAHVFVPRKALGAAVMQWACERAASPTSSMLPPGLPLAFLPTPAAAAAGGTVAGLGGPTPPRRRGTTVGMAVADTSTDSLGDFRLATPSLPVGHAGSSATLAQCLPGVVVGDTVSPWACASAPAVGTTANPPVAVGVCGAAVYQQVPWHSGGTLPLDGQGALLACVRPLVVAAVASALSLQLGGADSEGSVASSVGMLQSPVSMVLRPLSRYPPVLGAVRAPSRFQTRAVDVFVKGMPVGPVAAAGARESRKRFQGASLVSPLLPTSSDHEIDVTVAPSDPAGEALPAMPSTLIDTSFHTCAALPHTLAGVLLRCDPSLAKASASFGVALSSVAVDSHSTAASLALACISMMHPLLISVPVCAVRAAMGDRGSDDAMRDFESMCVPAMVEQAASAAANVPQEVTVGAGVVGTYRAPTMPITAVLSLGPLAIAEAAAALVASDDSVNDAGDSIRDALGSSTSPTVSAAAVLCPAALCGALWHGRRAYMCCLVALQVVSVLSSRMAALRSGALVEVLSASVVACTLADMMLWDNRNSSAGAAVEAGAGGWSRRLFDRVTQFLSLVDRGTPGYSIAVLTVHRCRLMLATRTPAEIQRIAADCERVCVIAEIQSRGEGCFMIVAVAKSLRAVAAAARHAAVSAAALSSITFGGLCSLCVDVPTADASMDERSDPEAIVSWAAAALVVPLAVVHSAVRGGIGVPPVLKGIRDLAASV